MKNYNPLYYLLFILLIMGAFASMAQNSYGLSIIGIVCFIFGLVFLIEIISLLLHRKNESTTRSFLEPVCLLAISIIWGFRVFYIYIPNIEWIFGAAVTLLIILYFVKMIANFHYYQDKNRFLAVMSIVFHLSIILFLASLALILFVSSVAEGVGALAMVFLLCFIVAGLLRNQVLVGGNNLSAIKMATSFKGHPILIAILILLLSLYFGLNRVGLLPAIYSDEYPQAYFELVNQAETGKEKAVNGEYKYQEFSKKYDQFLQDNKGRTKSD